ncbi:hypothetical protein FACS1894139_00630 [Planctomycetales bacterium]|nr:hypothetical protein FACS1894107_01500 [Planctomycetales bacterium]GHS99338.1 hypothetical protein FACS1894108_09120 [Planctomycetales bacterium]GHT02450.1 hypothetical protein FACS1894139_00630 [Planctomycetales bacterium]
MTKITDKKNAAPVVILDRDGTIIADKNYLARAEQVELLPNAAAGLRQMQRAGCRLLVATNQSGIGRGYFTVADYEKVAARLAALLADEGVRLDGVYYCPHSPTDGCACRKPRAGLVERAAREWRFAWRDCVVIGDKPSDIELGKNVGARLSIIIGAEKGGADAAVADLVEAAERIKVES